MRKRALAALAALAVGALAAGCGGTLGGVAEEKPRPALVAGTVRDPEGVPVEGVPVRVVALKEPLREGASLPDGAGETLARGTTDADGTFRVEFERKGGGLFYYLDFRGEGRFDDVRFLRPAPVALHERLREGPRHLHGAALAYNPLWPQVEALLKKYEPGSHRARVLRERGIPEGRTREGGKMEGEVEVWWYYSKGVSFRFREGVLLRENRFRPVAR